MTTPAELEEPPIGVTLVDCGSAKVGDIAALLGRHGATVTRVALADANQHPFGDGAVVISGGPRLFTSEPRLLEAFAFLDSLSAPILGICLGHQALALRAGGRVFLGPERRGPEQLRALEPHPLLAGLGERFEMLADHCEGVTLPPTYRRVACSDHYEIEAMAHEQAARFGVQFHPEVSGEVGEQLIASFVRWARQAFSPR